MTDFRSLPRKVKLFASNEVKLGLVYYPPGLVQSHHTHQSAQMSVLLAGGFRECSGFKDADPSQRVSALKSAGASHAVTFGPYGALMLSMDLTGELDVPLRQAGDWRPLSPDATALALAVVSTPDREDVVGDLMAAIRHEPLQTGRVPPASVRRLKLALDDDPCRLRLRDLAETSDIHRVHLSRAFTAAYGLPPSLYRRRRMAAEAMALTCNANLSLAHIASQAGFADQSHLTRAFKREIGLNPTAIRKLFNVTYVQDTTRHEA